MSRMKQRRPEPAEHAPYYGRYIDLVPEIDIIGALEKQGVETQKVLSTIDETRGKFRYAPDKWSIKQLVGHLEDTERVFTYRALTFARGARTPLPGFDEGEFMANSPFESSTMRQRADGLASVRVATIGLFRGFDDEAWDRGGVASDNKVSVRALAYMTLGHERHHLNVLRERYAT
jgi:hypothetical protein